MIRFLPAVLLAALFCAFVSCKKDPPTLPTIVKGKVVNSKTGSPIAGATIEFYNTILDNNNIPSITVSESVTSDMEGNFIYTVRSDAISVFINRVYAGHFITKRADYGPFEIKFEKTNQMTIPLIPSNAVLNLHIRNETGQQNFVNTIIENPTLVSEAQGSFGKIFLYPLAVVTSQEKTYSFQLVDNEYTKIYWDLNNFISNQTSPSNQDSVFILTNDTLDYSIIF